MHGHFSVVTTGPPGSAAYAAGTRMTVVADANTGQMLDFALDDGTEIALPNALAVYRRGSRQVG